MVAHAEGAVRGVADVAPSRGSRTLRVGALYGLSQEQDSSGRLAARFDRIST